VAIAIRRFNAGVVGPEESFTYDIRLHVPSQHLNASGASASAWSYGFQVGVAGAASAVIVDEIPGVLLALVQEARLLSTSPVVSAFPSPLSATV